ncbi:Ig-like domain-containing protein [Planktotalea frisia]|nr:Ig-like domain-containing protein [Planktotalea frisia]
MIEIAGPVGRVEIDYDNGETGSQEIFASDLLFTTTDPVPAADPVATDDTATTPIDTLIEDIDVLGNDTDPNGDIVTLVPGSATSADGIVTENPDGTLNFDPIPGFTGDAIVTYTIEDGNGGTDTGTLTVTVTPAGGNSAPTAVDDGPIDAESGVLFDDIFVVGNDFDPDGDPFTVTLASAPNGTVTVNPDGTLNYTSDAGFVGQDTITYTIDDVISGTDTATVLVNVAAGPNGPPVAEDDAATTPFDTLIEDIDVLGNDTDPDGDPITLVPGSATSADGTVTENPDGTLNFDPTSGFTGDAIVTYDIEDGNGGTDTGTLTVTVTPAGNLDPVATDDTATTPIDTLLEDIDVLGNDTGPDGDPVTLVPGSATSADGTVTENPDGTLNFDPTPGFTGDAIVTYDIEDGNGGTDTGTLTITVVNGDPVAVDDAATTPVNTLIEDIDVLGNDTDPDGDPVTLVPGSATSADGTVTENPDGTLDFDPPLVSQAMQSSPMTSKMEMVAQTQAR